MTEDPIKLREALYAAEPFLSYLLTERTAERNTKPLEKALSMVRGALDMPPLPKAKRRVEVDENPMAGHIELVSLVEHENGSCTASFDITDDAVKLLTRIGLMKVLNDAAKQHAEEQDGHDNDKE